MHLRFDETRLQSSTRQRAKRHAIDDMRMHNQGIKYLHHLNRSKWQAQMVDLLCKCIDLFFRMPPDMLKGNKGQPKRLTEAKGYSIFIL